MTLPFVEIMKMSEGFVVKVITKYDSFPLPYLGVIRMLQSVYGSDGKTKLTVDRSRQRLAIFSKKERLFCKNADLQSATLLKIVFSTDVFL